MSKWDLDSEWVVAPRQARSRKTMARVLDAAEDLFTSRGFEQTSIPDIAEAAGVSIGAIYARFADKDAILQVIHDSFSGALTANYDETFKHENWEGQSAATVIRALVDGFFNAYREHFGILCFLEQQRLKNPRVNDRFERWNGLTIAAYRGLLATRKKEINHPDIDNAVAVLHHLLHQTLATTALLENENAAPPFGIHDDQFKAELTLMALNYFGLKPGGELQPLPVWRSPEGW